MTAWPEWLTPEYSAMHTRIENALKDGEQHVYDSSDAAGLPWTATGMLSCKASAVLNALKRDGWTPSPAAFVAVEEAPWPNDGYVPDAYECDRCHEPFPDFEMVEREQNGTEELLLLCGSCDQEHYRELLARVAGEERREEDA